jgi:hypothetical protein
MVRGADMMTRIAIGAIRLVAIICFGVSLALPALKTTHFHTASDPWLPGWFIFFFGWLGIFGGQIAWLGNPALAVALIAPHSKFSRRISAPLLMICIFVALTALNSIQDDIGGTDPIIDFGSGYYFWLLALALGAALPFVALRSDDQSADAIDVQTMRSEQSRREIRPDIL